MIRSLHVRFFWCKWRIYMALRVLVAEVAVISVRQLLFMIILSTFVLPTRWNELPTFVPVVIL